MSKEMFIDLLPEGMAGEIVDCPDCQRVGFQRYRICYDHAFAHGWVDDATTRPVGRNGLAEALRRIANEVGTYYGKRDLNEDDRGHLHLAAGMLDDYLGLLDGDR